MRVIHRPYNLYTRTVHNNGITRGVQTFCSYVGCLDEKIQLSVYLTVFTPPLLSDSVTEKRPLCIQGQCAIFLVY